MFRVNSWARETSPPLLLHSQDVERQTETNWLLSLMSTKCCLRSVEATEIGARLKNKKLCTETRPCRCLRGDARYLLDQSHTFCRAKGRSNDAHPRQLPLHLLTEAFCSLFPCVFFSVISGSEGSLEVWRGANRPSSFLEASGLTQPVKCELWRCGLWSSSTRAGQPSTEAGASYTDPNASANSRPCGPTRPISNPAVV